ncbi:MAG: M28 family metallopeptidase [Planctomycetota bacterium]
MLHVAAVVSFVSLLLSSLPAVRAQAPVAAGAPPTAALPDGAPPAMAAIRGERLLAHAQFLASDELGGRLTGSPGQEQAAQYIADHFRSLGLEPLGDVVDGERTFFQRYGVTRTYIDPASVLRFGPIETRHGYAVLTGGPVQLACDGVLKFRGRGRNRGGSAEVAADEDLTDEVPLVLIKMPKGRVDRDISVEQKFMMSFRAFGTLSRTTASLQKQGAKLVVFALVDDPLGLIDVLNYLALSPGKDLMNPRFPGADASMTAMARMLGGADGPPSLVLSPALSAKVFAEMGLEHAALQEFLDGDGELPAAKTTLPARVALQVEQDDEATASNVVACLRGADPQLAHEAVVFSAHMDHVGGRMDGEVFRGADDNASGSAGLLGIATAFAKAVADGAPPRRSAVFLSVSGEELGLWGSAYYADHPTWDGEIVADVNTDMIGRSGPESGPMEVMVTPSHRHDMFSTIVQDAARFGEQLGMSLTDGDKYYERSDHYNFARKGIPVVFFCTGEHADYHQVTDTPDKLDPDKMQRVARLAFWTGWAVANADEVPRTLGRRADWK